MGPNRRLRVRAGWPSAASSPLLDSRPRPEGRGLQGGTPRALREHRAQGGVELENGKTQDASHGAAHRFGTVWIRRVGKRDERRDARGFRDAHDGAEIAGILNAGANDEQASVGKLAARRTLCHRENAVGRIQVAHAPEQPLGKLHSWNTLGHRPRKCARDHHRLDLCTSMNGGRGGIHELSAFEQKLVFALARLRETANRLDERVLRAFDALHLSLAEGERPGYHSKTL